MNNEFIDITYEKGPPVGSPFYQRWRLLNRNRFCQVTRLVNVGAFDQRDVVSQQLQRNGVEDRCNHLFHMRHLDDVHVIATYKTRILIGEDIQLTTTRELLQC